jgi:hypothetical protein
VSERAVDLARKAARLGEPEEGLAAVVALRAHLDALEARHVETAYAAGLSWREIAGLLGVSRQAVHKKYAARFRARREGDASDPRPPLTARVREAVAFARQEAGSMGHRSVGPEHLLLGLLRDDAGPAAEALESLGVSFGAARREVRRLYGQAGTADEGASPAAEAPISNRAQVALERALRESGRQEGRRVGVEHVLAALVRDPAGGAVRVLAALGVTPGQVEGELRSRLQRVGKANQSRPNRSEKAMPDDLQSEELTEEEIETQIRAALPDREAMPMLPTEDSDDQPPEHDDEKGRGDLAR